MYQQFVKDIQIKAEGLILERYERLNPQCKALCVNYSHNRITETTHTIWIEANGMPYYLGFIRCEPRNIMLSRYMDAKVNHSSVFGGVDPRAMAECQGYCIVDWMLDDRLKNNLCLSSIFTRIASAYYDANNRTILWMDGLSELISYPIEDGGFVRVGSHFADAFMMY